MGSSKRQWTNWATFAIGMIAAASLASAQQVIDEHFNTVTGSGGGTFVTDGTGFNTTPEWDNGIAGEGAFAGGTGFSVIGDASAYGVPTGGVAGSGAGVIDVSSVRFLKVREDFEAAAGTGAFTTNGAGSASNFDDGIAGERAYVGVSGAATLGSFTAEGVMGGGESGGNGGRMTVQNVTLNGGDWSAGMSWDAALPVGKPVNTSFEEYTLTGGDRPVGYFAWGNAWAVAASPGEGLEPRTGNRLLKMWGNWSGTWNNSGVGQSFPSQEGDVWEIECWVKQITGDNLVGTGNFVLLQIEFFNEAEQRVGVQEVNVLNSGTPLDQWIHVTPFQGVAPANTVAARCIVMFLQPNFEGGAAEVEDLAFRRVSGPPANDLSDLYLSADVQGAVVGGQSLGDYTLRLEDGDGDALEFVETADGTFQHVGGPLASATTAAPDAQHPNADGVFDPDSSQYTISLAFADPAASWGTGGMLTLDNLLLASNSADGSAWYGGLYWENVVAPVGYDPAHFLVAADVLGAVPGGDYQLRVEAYRQQVVNNVDDDFDAVTGTGGGYFLDGDSVDTTFYASNWDDGINGEEAFGGVFGDGTEICDPTLCPVAGFSVQGLPSGGMGGGGSGQIKVENIIYSVGGGWYGGLRWPNQVLPVDPDLSQITLSADILGTPLDGTVTYGDYELRIEDSQNDRLYFHMTADGTWQHVGGTLDTATEGGATDGGGNGVFDLDSPPFAVVVAFTDEVDTWNFGGTLTVDNLFLTSGSVRREIGRSVFHQTADGTFQTVGGMLADGDTAQRSELSEDFATATGTGGGEFFNSNGGGYVASYDSGIAAAEAFGGTWGDPMITTGGIAAYACSDCGMAGSAAAVIDVYGITPDVTTSGWWAGLSFIDVHPVMTDLSAVTLTADIKGLADAGAGETYGTYQLRIEDPELDFLGFTVTADGTWQSVGGSLATAETGSAGSGNGVLDTNAEYYHVVVTMTGNGLDWNRGGTLIVDNLQLNGLTLADADDFTVVVTFENEVDTWGAAGALTVDNLLLTTATSADCDSDADVDLMDFATIQACFGGAPAGACACMDLDNDGDIDAGDQRIFVFELAGP
ncbi:MAG: hypothetical protein H6816_06855 [Phycisphaerales bacterium]|nr:hypothetical protein [Phycisphaerales bacterium]